MDVNVHCLVGEKGGRITHSLTHSQVDSSQFSKAKCTRNPRLMVKSGWMKGQGDQTYFFLSLIARRRERKREIFNLPHQ